MSVQSSRYRTARTLFVVMLLVAAVGMAAFTVDLVRSERLQAQSLFEIQSVGGLVCWATIGPSWVSRLPGAEYLPQRAIGVHLFGTQVTDDALAHIGALTDLEVLRLIETRVTDAGLAHLKGLTRLEVLLIAAGGGESSEITDNGLVHLKGLINLKELKVFLLGRITDSGVNELRRALPNLSVYREARP